MATTIPANGESFITEGEKQSYLFLEAVAKPDAQYLCWYLPDVQGKEPDFILFSNKLGLIVLEVKALGIYKYFKSFCPHLTILCDMLIPESCMKINENLYNAYFAEFGDVYDFMLLSEDCF